MVIHSGTSVARPPYRDAGLPPQGLIASWIAFMQDESFNLCLWSEKPTQWTYVNASGADDTGPDPVGGNNAGTVSFSSATGYGRRPRSFLGNADKTYTMSVWLRVSSGTKQVRIGVLNGSTDAAIFSTVVTVTTSWQRFSATGTVPSGITYFGPFIQSQGDTAPVHAFGMMLDEYDGIRAYRKTADIVTAKDFSINAKHLTIYGSPIWEPFGLVLNGSSQYGDVADDAVLFGSDKLTVGGVIYVSSFAAGRPFLNRRTTGDVGGFSLQTGAAAGQIDFLVYAAGGWRQLSTSGWNAGQWYHIAAVYDRTAQRIYRGDALLGSNSWSDAAMNNPASPLVRLGRDHGTNYLAGRIAAMYWYNRALGQNEISQIYDYLKRSLQIKGVAI